MKRSDWDLLLKPMDPILRETIRGLRDSIFFKLRKMGYDAQRSTYKYNPGHQVYNIYHKHTTLRFDQWKLTTHVYINDGYCGVLTLTVSYMDPNFEEKAIAIFKEAIGPRNEGK